MAGLQQHWNLIPGSNQTADPAVNLREGMAPSQMNDAARQIMAKAKAYALDTSGTLVTTGISTAFALVTNEGFTSLQDGLTVAFRLHLENGPAPTLQVDILPAKPLRAIASVNLAGSDGFVLGVCEAVYSTANGGEWLLQGRHARLDAPAGTRMIFTQAAAPLGWVKETNAAFNDAAIRLTTALDGGNTGNATGFNTAFTARTIAQANLPNVNFTGTSGGAGSHNHGGATVGSDGAHTHDLLFSNVGRSGADSNCVSTVGAGAASTTTGATGSGHQHNIATASDHTHSLTVNSGGSGTEGLDFAVKHVNHIVATKA